MSLIEGIAVHIAEAEILENKRTALSLIEWNPSSALLDCGCNDGNLTIEIAKKIETSNIYGIDIVSNNVNAAKTKKIKVYQGDLNTKLPFPDEMFDMVHVSHIIEHLYNTDLFVKELYRVLKFGGYSVISTPNLSSFRNILYLIFGKQPPAAHVSDEVVVGGWKATYTYPPFLSGPKHRRLFTFGALTGLCKYNGLRVEKCKGSGFYPFPPFISRLLTPILKPYSSHISIKVRKCYL